MRCDDLRAHIDRLLGGTLPAAEARALRAHVDRCADCAGIVRALSEPPEPTVDLASEVLARTTGAVCGVVEEWTVLGSAPAETARLLAEHREHCDRCRSFSVLLADLDRVLPELAEVAPDAAFTADVLRRTTRHVSRWSAVRRRLEAVWADLGRRPNFSLELAYAVTVILVMLTVAPRSPLQPLATATLNWLQSDAKAESLPLELTVPGASRVEGLAGDLAERGHQVSLVWVRVSEHGVELGEALWAGDLERVGLALGDLGCDAKLLWQGARKRLPEGEPQCGDE